MINAIVIGLGPSGSSTLKRLKEQGIEAIGIERKR